MKRFLELLKLRERSRALVMAGLTGSIATASWLTFGGNPQRNGWAQNETSISADTVKGMQLLWKVKLENQPKELNL